MAQPRTAKKKPKNEEVNRIKSALRMSWRNVGQNYKDALLQAKQMWVVGRKSVGYKCQHCGIMMRAQENGKQPFQIDHVLGVCSHPWDINNPDWNLFITRLFHGQCELLCKDCHQLKTNAERGKLKVKETTQCAMNGKLTASKSRAAKPRLRKNQPLTPPATT